MSKRAILLPLMVLALSLIAPVAHGRQRPNQDASTRIPVTVAIFDKLPYPGVISVIIRRTEGSFKDGSRPDLIVLGPNANNARGLSAAISDLILIRAQQGDTATSHRVIRLRPKGGARGRGESELPWAQQVIDDLREARPQFIDGLGEARALDIWLPPQRSR